MKFIIGEKKNMTQVFDTEGVVSPVTILSVGPITVTQVKSNEKDGYQAIQVGYGSKSPKNQTKALKGHLKELGNFKVIKEFRTDASYNVGDQIDLSQFAAGDMVTVTGTSKGKGFQGVVKRHGFGGGPRSHGQKHSEREPGSISQGLRTGPHKGLRMAGRMGADRITEKSVKIIEVNPEAGTIAVKGSVPGRRGTILEIKAK